MLNKFLLIVFIAIMIGFLIALYALLAQAFGIESEDKATIIGGILSMIGGIVGALGAYFIARMQMTKQLDLQYKKEEEKMIKEIKINNYLTVSKTCNDLLGLLNELQTSSSKFLVRFLTSSNKIHDFDEEILIQLQPIKGQSTKLLVYKVFFDDRVKFPDTSKDIKELEKGLYEALFKYSKIEIDENNYGEIVEQIVVEINQLTDKAKEGILKILTYANFYLKNSIDNEVENNK